MNSKVNLIRSIDEASFTQLDCVFWHRLSKWAGDNAEFRDLKGRDFFDRAPNSIDHSHSYSILGIRVEAFDEAVAIVIVNFFKYLLSLDFHANTKLYLILDILEW